MLDNLSPSDAARIEKAVSVLSRDGLVVYPTETVTVLELMLYQNLL